MGDLFSAVSRLMRMDARTWERHASPWSVWTRVPIGPLLILAVYARAWIGWWCLLPVGLLLLWTTINPRAFPPPRSLSNWSARGVMGERFYLARRRVPIPEHHRLPALALTGLSLLGLSIAVYGLVVLAPWPTALGASVMTLAKLWFVDRMAWLCDEMKAQGHDPRG